MEFVAAHQRKKRLVEKEKERRDLRVRYWRKCVFDWVGSFVSWLGWDYCIS